LIGMTSVHPLLPVLPSAVAIGPFRIVPNAITLVRTVLAVLIGGIAAESGNLALLAVAYSVYWIGDIADGWVARRLDQETRAGAVLDIVSDRACTAVLAVGFAVAVPAALPVVVVFLLSFMVLDTMLSLAFLCWPVVSPNYFDAVDRRVWQLNWSPAAKAANTAGVVGALALGAYVVALLVALAVIAVKVWSAYRVVGLLGASSP
jgi:CDP-diacylglycerol--glycerol-3-phosphate 3-phosphatidyltransferase